MARSDLLLSLVRAGANGDKTMLRSTVEALMADERAKSHHGLADRLEHALQSVSVAPSKSVVQAISSGRESILEQTARLRLDDLVLTLPALREAKQLVEEHVRADILRAHGYEPRHKILLSGPPGNGKTSFAEAIAEALALPFFVVRYDALIGSFLGETNTRLRALFDFVRTRSCVLFFDEFDSIGKERGDTHETGEIKRVVSFLLMQIDQLPSYVLTIAATNHAELLDRAVWRRFQIRLAFPSPSGAEIQSYLDSVMQAWPSRPKIATQKLAKEIGDVSYAEVRDFCQNVRRRQILSLGALGIDSAVQAELELWRLRVNPGAVNGDRFKQTVTPPRGQRKSKSTEGKTKSAAKT